MNKLIGFATVALVTVGLNLASADVTQTVEKEFRGQILITTDGLPDSRSTDTETIAAFKKANVKSLTHTENEDEVAEWRFSFTAFLKKAPKASSISVDFYTADKDMLYVANKGMMGIDPNGTIVNGALNINEDDGVNRNRTYIVKLTAKVKNRETVLAETKLVLK